MSFFAWVLVITLVVTSAALVFIKTTGFKMWVTSIASIMIAALFFSWLENKFILEGVFQYNMATTSAIRFSEIPIETPIYYLVIPFVSMFVYRLTKHLYSKKLNASFANKFSIVFLILFAVLGVIYNHKAYTLIISAFSCFLLITQLLAIKGKYMKYFWIAYLFQLIPFLIIEEIICSKPVIQFYDTGISGIKLGYVPVETLILNLCIFLLPVTLTELLKPLPRK